jgi:hypothetical protein
MSLDSKIVEIEKLVKKNIDRLPELRLFLITHNQWLRVYNGRKQKNEEFEELSIIRHLRPRRGDILNWTSKLEFLVNELIQAKFLGLFSPKGYELDDLLRHVNFNSKINILRKWRVITKSQQGHITKVVEVRNQLAHKWDEKEVFYGKTKGKNIIENIGEFRKDAEKVWTDLIEIYMKEKNKQIGKLISQLDDPNTINAWAEISKNDQYNRQLTDEDANDNRYFPSI